ncbi:hypothetical protein MNBD_GAMMA02-233 [hydrothermal vent metagenome]|uniref:Uncharacterized protein n=1 Tax=hydrothermal vent metagenome TaxID=652676 RepID=A0A3B0WR61_9ZZZZ
MKKTLIIILTMAASTGFSMDASQLKEQALKVCETQLENVPEDMREMSKKICECKANKTDYEAVLTVKESGDTEKITADALKIAQECAEEVM